LKSEIDTMMKDNEETMRQIEEDARNEIGDID
jgi:hypothetical protein